MTYGFKILIKSMQALAVSSLLLNGAYAEDVAIVGTLKQTLKQENTKSLQKVPGSEEKPSNYCTCNFLMKQSLF